MIGALDIACGRNSGWWRSLACWRLAARAFFPNSALFQHSWTWGPRKLLTQQSFVVPSPGVGRRESTQSVKSEFPIGSESQVGVGGPLEATREFVRLQV
uniref:Uncharacterized protein n=1 Tax=Plectus sambesii TaxID=2011161 RepID=A0A914V603_9BILA